MANPLAPFGLKLNDRDQLILTRIPSMELPPSSRNSAHSPPLRGRHLTNRMMIRRVNSTNPDTISKQVKTHRRPAITSRIFQGIRSIFQRHVTKPPTYPIGEGVCYHPDLNNLDEENTTDEDEPYSPQPSLNRGDENLWIILSDPQSRLTEAIPIATAGLFLNPLEIPNINTLAQIKRRGYITFK